jgi:hypothetical protein
MMTGDLSRRAPPAPDARFTAPGPNVPWQTPGIPVILPVTLAMVPAADSCEVRMNSIPAFLKASMYGMEGPPGTPKTNLTPAPDKIPAICSATVISIRIVKHKAIKISILRCGR